ncbi:hypothetical protein PXK20_05385 [Phaeobacter gallaeciensis]|nr:hypothetical protein [Phaeobacter gallaeciensis]
MVQAILREIQNPGTGKTQTRRVLKPQPTSYQGEREEITQIGKVGYPTEIFTKKLCNGSYGEIVKFAPGDRLWVREAWRSERSWDNLPPRDLFAADPIWTEADGEWSDIVSPSHGFTTGKLRPSMFMPRWASRITLDVTDVRVQRLQEISGSDAAAEGVQLSRWITGNYPFFDNGVEVDNAVLVDKFRTLWDSLNADRGFGWRDNPWVVAVTFRPHLCNIDQTEKAA